MNDGSLPCLIRGLERGTHLKIGVVFFGKKQYRVLTVPFEMTIHTGAYCRIIKERHGDQQACERRRTAALTRVAQTGEPFDGMCQNGVWEYTAPLRCDGELLGAVFVGNRLGNEADTAVVCRCLAERGRQGEQAAVLQTMARDVSLETCREIAGVIERYIQLLLWRYPEEDTADRTRLIGDLIGFLEEHPDGAGGMREAAALFHYNEKYLARLFKAVTGDSVRVYFCKRRIARAARLLCETEEPVTAIATRVGFENIPYFNRRFVQYMGMSPRNYRRTHKHPSD